MKIITAAMAHEITNQALKAERVETIKNIMTCILTRASFGGFSLNVRIENTIIQDYLFDYFTAQGYKVNFSELSPRDRQLAPADARIMNISWEDAIV